MGEVKSYIEKEGVKEMPWSTFFQRTANIPLDRSSMFSSLEDAKLYAKGDEQNPDTRNLVSSSYIGQIITVYENDEVNVYKINAERELEPFGKGKGLEVINDTTELDKFTNNVGQMVYNLGNNTIYFVSKEGINNTLFSFNDNGITTFDAGTY